MNNRWKARVAGVAAAAGLAGGLSLVTTPPASAIGWHVFGTSGECQRFRADAMRVGTNVGTCGKYWSFGVINYQVWTW